MDGWLDPTDVGASFKPAFPSLALGTASTPTVECGYAGVPVHQVPRDTLRVIIGAGCCRIDFDVVRGSGVQVLELVTGPTWLPLRSTPLSLLQDVETAVDSNVAQPVASEYGKRIGYVVRSSIR